MLNHVIKNESTALISRVLFAAAGSGEPVIYLIRMSPHGLSILPSIAAQGIWADNPFDDGLHELAAPRRHSPPITRRLVVSYTTFSPLPHTRRGGCFLLPFSCCHQQLPLSEVGRPMLPGLSSRPAFQQHQRQAVAVFPCAKVVQKIDLAKENRIYFIF